MFVHVDVRPFDPLEARLGMEDCGIVPDTPNRNLLRKGSARRTPWRLLWGYDTRNRAALDSHPAPRFHEISAASAAFEGSNRGLDVGEVEVAQIVVGREMLSD